MADAPNLLFFFTDQQRYDWVGTNPDVPVRTPNLSALAERGVEFTNAVCPSPLCGPSRACLASGMEYDRCGVLDHSASFPLDRQTYYGRLRDEAGYHVMGCGKFDLHKPEPTWGVDGQHAVTEWGFSDAVDTAGKWDGVSAYEDRGGPADPYLARLAERGFAEAHVADYERRRAAGRGATFPTPLPEHLYADNVVPQVGLELLSRAPDDRPWHLQVNFSGPHDPWDVTEEMHGWYRDPDVAFPAPDPPADQFDAGTYQAVRRNYAAMVENVDRWLGRYLDKLRTRNELAETLVVFAADHGEMLGDRNRWLKKTPYQPSVGVPMVVAGPGVEPRTAAAPATVLDLHATFLDYAGLDAGGVDSRTLRPVLAGDRDPADHRDAVYSGLGAWRLAFDGRLKLVEGYDPRESFEDWAEEHDPGADPILWDLGDGEDGNLADECPAAVERLRETIAANREPAAMENAYTGAD